MSISPQSLARTRDKRNLRIPRKFEDFSLVTSGDVPTDVTHSTYRNFADALKMKGKPSSVEENVIKKSPFHPSITISNGIRISGPVTKQPMVEKRPSTSTPVAPPTPVDPPAPVEPSTPVPPPTPVRVAVPVVVAAAAPPKPVAAPPTPILTSTPAKLSTPVPSSTPVATSTPSNYHPPPTPKPVPRKKSRGFSLMLKTPNTGLPFQGNINNIANGTNNAQIINGANNRPMVAYQQQLQQQQQIQQQPKYYNNLSQNMQYGTRLMINEPIYLPRSVGTIAPITTNLQQIANQAKRSPFISRKAEAFLAYQDVRKFDYMASSYTALQRITKFLEVQDLLNLRLVNRTWKSIIDSDSCWRKVKVKESKIVDWQEFVDRLYKYGTTDLIFDEFTPSISNSLIIDELCRLVHYRLKRIWIKTVDEIQNKFAIELACALNSAEHFNREIMFKWKVKVVVDECGIALIPTRGEDPKVKKSKAGKKLYCYSKLPEMLADPKETVLVELSDLEDLFNGGKNDIGTHKRSGSSCKLRIDIKPI